MELTDEALHSKASKDNTDNWGFYKMPSQSLFDTATYQLNIF